MANTPLSAEQQQTEAAAGKKKALIVLIIGGVLISLLFYFFKNKKADFINPMASSQDSFQGPAELSSVVQINCQDSAKKIFEQKNCSDKQVEFFQNAENCLNVYCAIDAHAESASAEGNYGDFSLQIAKCYSENEKSNSKAVEFLQKVNSELNWDVYMGPISCDSKSTLAAHIEAYSKAQQFKCFKTSDFENIISELKNKKVQILRSMLSGDEVPYQGIVEADMNCPETVENIENNLLRLLSKGDFEVVMPNPQSAVVDDIFIEINRNNNRLLNLQFKIKSDGCLHFQSLLAPSTEIE